MEEEIQKRQKEIDELNRRAAELNEKGAKPVIEPTLIKLNKRWAEIKTQFAQYKRPQAVAMDTSEISETTRVVTSMQVTQSSSQKVVFSKVNKVNNVSMLLLNPSYSLTLGQAFVLPLYI